MKLERKDPPRRFQVGNLEKFDLSDCGSLALDPDEQVTFTTPAGAEYDVVRKDWGFYATPSLNGRLARFGLRGTLVRNTTSGQYYLLLVERGREPAFDAYCAREGLEIVAWLDDQATCDRVRAAILGLSA